MPPCVLIVDDDPAIRTMIELMLAHCGYTPLVARNGHAALAHLQTAKPDLILLDLNLPGMPGRELCHHLKATTAIPVVIMSGHSPTEPAVREIACQADGYLIKPFGVNELLEILSRVLPMSQPVLRAG